MHALRAGGELGHVDPNRTQFNQHPVGALGQARAAADELAERLAADNLTMKLASLKKHRRKKDLRDLSALAKAKGVCVAMGHPWDPRNDEPFFDGLLSASGEHFARKDDAPEPAPPTEGETKSFERQCWEQGWDPDRVERWKRRSVAFLRAKFGRDGLLNVRFDLDETTPHLQFVGAPITRDPRTSHWRLSQRTHWYLGEPKLTEAEEAELAAIENEKVRSKRRAEMMEAKPTSYERAQTDYAKAMERFGIERGERRAEADREAKRLGREVERRDHIAPADFRAAAVELLGRAEGERVAAAQEREGAAQECAHAATERREAEAVRRRAEALQAGVGAVVAEQVVYAPARLAQGGQEAKPERLLWGPEAPTEPQAKVALFERIKPAWNAVVAFAKRFQREVERRVADAVERATAKLREHEVGVAKREEAVTSRASAVEAEASALERRRQEVADREFEVRERAKRVERDALVVEAARRTSGRPVPSDLEEIARAARERQRNRQTQHEL